MMNSPLSNRQPNWPNRRFDQSAWQHKSIKIFPPQPAHQHSELNDFKKTNHEPSSLTGLKAISFSELIKPLAEALKQNQEWVRDFGQEKIILPADLHEIVLMFGELQQGKTTDKASGQDNPPESETS